jgi:hypothetical protein
MRLSPRTRLARKTLSGDDVREVFSKSIRSATIMNLIEFRIGSTVLGLTHLSEIYELAENAAKHDLLPTEDDSDAQPPTVQH